jgi:uncharacterized protein (TIGR00369 family)
MAPNTETHSRLLSLFEQLPEELQPMVLDTLERLGDRDERAGPFGWLLGYHYTGAEGGEATCVLDVSEQHLNPSGVAHGGILCTVADAAMGGAVHRRLPAEQRCVTAELKVNYLKPIFPGEVTAQATVVHIGRRLAVATAEIYDQTGQTVGVALGTFAIISRSRPSAAEADTSENSTTSNV